MAAYAFLTDQKIAAKLKIDELETAWIYCCNIAAKEQCQIYIEEKLLIECMNSVIAQMHSGRMQE